MTREVRLLFRNTHRLYRIAKRTKNEFDIKEYRDARRIAKKCWRKARYTYNVRVYAKNGLSQEAKSAALWKIIKLNYGKSAYHP